MKWVIKDDKKEKYKKENVRLLNPIEVPTENQDKPERYRNWYISGMVFALFDVANRLGVDPQEYVDEYKNSFQLID